LPLIKFKEKEMRKLIGLVILFFLLSSCVIVIENPPGFSTYPSIKKFHKVVPLSPGSTLSLENMYGDIVIHGWDREEVEITAEKILRQTYERRVYWYRKTFAQPDIEVDKFEDFLKIKTKYDDVEEEEYLINYYLFVPKSIIIKNITNEEGDIFLSDFYGEAFLELGRGDIKVENFSGSLDISIIEGSVKASLYDLRKEDRIEIITKKGDIIVFLQPNVNADLEVKTPDGSISSEFKVEETLPAKELIAKLGEGGAFLSLSSLKGNIKIKKLKP
jgi:hypothetical protein